MAKGQHQNSSSEYPLQIGVTGGIGSGKTIICKIFASLGVPVYNADDRARQIMVEDENLKSAIIENFGEESYLADGQLNRPYLASIVFNDADRLNILNSLVHPAVMEDGIVWHQSKKGVSYTVREAALIIESGIYKSMDRLILVTAPQELRIERVMKRDKVDRQAVLARMQKQMPEKEKEVYADFIITNDGKSSIVKQVVEIHRQLLKLAGF